MNNEQSVLLKLIKQSQFGLSEPINLSGIDMSILYNEALSQAVLGLVASEIPTNYLTKKWNQYIYKQKSLCIRYCYIENELKIILDKAEIALAVDPEYDVIAFLDLIQELADLLGPVLKIVIHPDHQVTVDVVQAGKNRRMLPEILCEVHSRDLSGIALTALQDRLIGMVAGMIVHQDHLAFIAIPLGEAFHTLIGDHSDRLL